MWHIKLLSRQHDHCHSLRLLCATKGYSNMHLYLQEIFIDHSAIDFKDVHPFAGGRLLVNIWCYCHLPRAVRHLLFNACVNLLTGIGTWCTGRSRASQTCSVVAISGEYAGHARAEMFQLSVITDLCNMKLCIYMLHQEAMKVDEWHENQPEDFIIIFVYSDCHK